MKLVGERRALAAAILAFYFILFLLGAIQTGGESARALFALAGVYGLAFFSIVAGYFWARWYAVGVGLFGVIVAAALVWQTKTFDQMFVFFGGTHLSAALALWGHSMSEPFDGQQAWRDRFHMDENAVQRLGRSVIRAGVSLPFILLYALAPRPDALGFVALAIALLGFRGLVQLRTWGVLLLGVAGAILTFAPAHAVIYHHAVWTIPALPIALLLFAAVAPFARPILAKLAPAA
jgi:hypothetical protein